MTGVEYPLLVLTPRPWKWLSMLAISILFVVAGWWMAHHADEPFKRMVGWFGLIFFGLGAVVSVIQLIPRASSVVATSKGLYIKTFLRSYHYGWNEIDRFGVAEWTRWHGPFRQRHRYVGILFVVGPKHLARGRSHSWTKAFWGYHASLPDNYGYKYQDLADRLNMLLVEHRT